MVLQIGRLVAGSRLRSKSCIKEMTTARKKEGKIVKGKETRNVVRCEVAGLPTSSRTNVCSYWRLRLRHTKERANEVHGNEERSVEQSENSPD